MRPEGGLSLLQVLFWCGWIAQLVEQAIENRCVPSSILGPATTFPISKKNGPQHEAGSAHEPVPFEVGEAHPFDIKLESWKAGSVKMTLDIPEDLLRELKIRAAKEGKTFKLLMSELFRNGLDLMEKQKTESPKARGNRRTT